MGATFASEMMVGEIAAVLPDLSPYALLASPTFTGTTTVAAGTVLLPGLAVSDPSTGVSFGGAAGVTEALVLSSNGVEFLRGVGNAASTSLVTLTGSATTLSLKLQNNTTDTTAQTYVVAERHYTAAEEPLGVIHAFSDATTGVLCIGGGAAILNAATSLKLFAAANNTTTTGTEIVRLTSTGLRIQLTGVTAAASNSFHIATTADADLFRASDTLGVLGVGVAPISGTKLAVVQASGTQLRLGYDTTNYSSFVEGSTGRLSITNNGTQPQTNIIGAGYLVDGLLSHLATGDTTALAAGVGGSLHLTGVYTGTTRTAFGAIKAYKATATDGETGGYLDLYSRVTGANLAANLRVGTEGRVLIRAGITTQVADTRLHVQGAAGTTLPVVTIEQLDDDEPFCNLVGTSEAGVTKSISSFVTVNGALLGWTRDSVNGTDVWRPYYAAPVS